MICVSGKTEKELKSQMMGNRKLRHVHVHAEKESCPPNSLYHIEWIAQKMNGVLKTSKHTATLNIFTLAAEEVKNVEVEPS